MSDVLRRDAYFYMLFCVEYNGLYIGSTWNLDERMTGHKSVCNNPNVDNHNLQVYQAIRANGGWDQWEVMEIDFVPDLTRKERKEHEQYLIDSYGANLNTYNAHTDWKEYDKQKYERDKERIKEQKRDYYQRTKGKKKAYNGNYYQEHKEQIKEQKKNYYQRTKEKRNAYNNKYREEHKEQLKAKRDAKKKAK